MKIKGGNMSINFNEEYRKLQQTRILLDPTIISNKKSKILGYFMNFDATVDLSNLKNRIYSNIILYKAPLFQIHRSNMLNCSTPNSDEIYIDEKFLITKGNEDIIIHQLTHETLHSLCKGNNRHMVFGHIITSDNEYMKGINEAVTQIFTDDIENSELGPKDDYLYFIKNIMRIMKNTVGPEFLVNQYLNNNSSFEDRFNEITNEKFNDFAFIINNIYKLNKEKHYGTINEKQNETLISNQDLILKFTSTFVRKVASNDPMVYTRIKDDFFNKEFLSDLKIEQLNNKPETK